jgi:hypothetical protein
MIWLYAIEPWWHWIWGFIGPAIRPGIFIP